MTDVRQCTCGHSRDQHALVLDGDDEGQAECLHFYNYDTFCACAGFHEIGAKDYWTPERRRELPYREIEESGLFEIGTARRVGA